MIIKEKYKGNRLHLANRVINADEVTKKDIPFLKEKGLDYILLDEYRNAKVEVKEESPEPTEETPKAEKKPRKKRTPKNS